MGLALGWVRGQECSLLFRIPDPLLAGEASQALSLVTVIILNVDDVHVGKLPFFYPISISSAWWLYYTIPAMVQPLLIGVMVEDYALPNQPQLLFLQPSKSVSKSAYRDDHWLLSYSTPSTDTVSGNGGLGESLTWRFWCPGPTPRVWDREK